jgi:hypothetical protein
MPAPTVSVVISQTPSNLTLSEANGYKVTYNGMGQPSGTWRRGYATSPWVEGALLTSAVLDQSVLNLSVLVSASSAAVLRTRMNALTAAVSQFTYTVAVTLNSQASTWTADPADWALDGEAWQASLLGLHMQRINLAIPVYPTAA